MARWAIDRSAQPPRSLSRFFLSTLRCASAGQLAKSSVSKTSLTIGTRILVDACQSRRSHSSSRGELLNVAQYTEYRPNSPKNRNPAQDGPCIIMPCTSLSIHGPRWNRALTSAVSSHRLHPQRDSRRREKNCEKKFRHAKVFGPWRWRCQEAVRRLSCLEREMPRSFAVGQSKLGAVPQRPSHSFQPLSPDNVVHSVTENTVYEQLFVLLHYYKTSMKTVG